MRRMMVVIIVIGLLVSGCTLADLQTWLQCETPPVDAEVVIASGAAAGTAGTVLNVQQLNGGVAVTLEMADGTAAVLVGCFEWILSEGETE